ncbi:MAG: hypothetical protein AVDCRST_MAG64-4236 [uncultured Phycisphaerae bacterium]|uniref:Uncharacterized protein n=1 Tax=uncultured Phycisphaerae bacterium TaxID=904963 RepID=A0A6J4QEJ8_9BACT|nr:MAG: hypothetical protein AVDCRST_MAG64-4236 [uncultured Phycisphaerae bacterium]
MHRFTLIAHLLLALTGALAISAPAHAGTYDVVLCDSSGPMPPGSTYPIELNSGQTTAYRGFLADNCGREGLGYYVTPQNAQRYDTTNGLGVRIPDEFPNLRMRRLSLLIGFQFGSGEGSTYFPRVTVPGRTLYEASSRNIDVQESVVADVDTRSFEYLTYCSFDKGPVDCDRYSSKIFSLDRAGLRLEDPAAPDVAALDGPLAADGPKRGTVRVTARGADQDSGVREIRVALGSTTVAARTPPPVVGQWRPYPRTAEDEFAVDTTKLADATYPLTATVTDAGGLTRLARGGGVVVDNLPPVPTGRPEVKGVPDAGQALTASEGTWKDLNGGFAYRWLRCNAVGDLCETVPGATQPTYATTATDVGSSLRVEVVATDASGTATQLSDATAAVTGVPSADAPNPPALFGVRGLSNPLAGRGAAPNGVNASGAATLVASLRKGRRGRGRTVIGRYGSRPVVLASLKANGAPVTGALVTIAERPLGGRWRALSTVTTDARGAIAATLPPGPSRSLRLYYFPSGTATEAVTSRRLIAGIKARVTFGATPRSVRNKGIVRFAGRVLGGTSPRGTLVTLQVRTGSRRWQAFRVTRSEADGDYRARFRFLRSRRGQRYVFRAVAKRQASLPYDTGSSRSIRVRVR